MVDVKNVKVKILGTWHEAIMERIPIREIEGAHYAIRRYILRQPMEEKTIEILLKNVFSEVECDDGCKSKVYVASANTLIEKDGSQMGM